MTNTTLAVCKLPACEDPCYALDMCERHYNKLRRIRRARGAFDHVDAGPTLAHVARLRARGWGWHTIARAGKTSTAMLHRLERGETPTLQQQKAERILAIPPTWQWTRVPVPGVGTRRRLSALAWQGWSGKAVAQQVGLSGWLFYNSAKTDRIEARNAAKIAEFFDRHAYKPGPDPIYAKRARTLGAIPAAAWDDDIDDPNAVPNLGERRSRGPRRRVHIDEVEHLTSFGLSLDAIAQRLDVEPASLREIIRRQQRKTAA